MNNGSSTNWMTTQLKDLSLQCGFQELVTSYCFRGLVTRALQSANGECALYLPLDFQTDACDSLIGQDTSTARS